MIKYPIFFLSLLLLAGQVSAQVIYERTYPYQYPTIQNPIQFPDYSTFSLGDRSDCGGIGTRHIDAQGNELLDNVLAAEVFCYGYHWLGNDSVLIWAEEGALDAGRDSFRVYVWTPDSLHKILSIDIRDVPWDQSGYGAYLYTPDRLVYKRFETLYSLDLTSGQIEDSLVIADINQVFEFEKSILVVSETDYPVLLNNRLDVIQIWADLSFLPFQIHEALVLDSFLVGRYQLDTLSIGAYNVYTETQQIIDLSADFDRIETIQANKNNLFVKGVSAGNNFVLQLDSTFSKVDFTFLDIPDVDKEFAYSYYPDRVYAWSFDGVANYKANYRICYLYEDANPIHYVDIGWDTIWVDSIRKHPPEWHVPASVFISGVVKNFSADTLHSLTLHLQDIPVFWCDDGVYPTYKQNLAILPFSTDTINFGAWSYPAGQDLPFQLTFFIQHGNEHLDTNTTDNVFTLHYLISSSSALTPLSFLIYPNPFTDFLRVEDASESTHLSLYDQTGRIVASGYSRLDDLEKLPAGMYLLQIRDGNSISVRSLAKVK